MKALVQIETRACLCLFYSFLVIHVGSKVLYSVCLFFLSGVNGQVTWFIDSKKAVFEYIFQLHAQIFNVSLVDYRFAWWLSESDNERCF